VVSAAWRRWRLMRSTHGVVGWSGGFTELHPLAGAMSLGTGRARHSRVTHNGTVGRISKCRSQYRSPSLIKAFRSLVSTLLLWAGRAPCLPPPFRMSVTSCRPAPPDGSRWSRSLSGVTTNKRPPRYRHDASANETLERNKRWP